jgi:hypothetical protein
MLTHDDGDKPTQNFVGGHLWDIPENIEYWLDSGCRPWILNIDLDYFFWHENEKRPGIMVSHEYLTACFEKIREKIEDQTVAVTTIALTPDQGLTGGWEATESLAQFIMRTLNVDFVLP